MSSLSDTTGDIKLDKPYLWTLTLFIDGRQIHFMLHNDMEADSLICRNIDIGKWIDEGEYLRALENVIYDNRLLLNDFKRVNVSVDSNKFIFLPQGYGPDDDVRKAFDIAFPDAEGDFVVSRGYNCNADVAYMVPQGVYRFLQRTFSNIPVRLNLEVLASYFRGRTLTSNVGKVAVYIRGDGRIDVCAFKRGKLQLANTYLCRSENDIMYYTLAVWNELGLDVHSDEIQVAGDKTVRASIMPRLREYVTYVVPVMVPPAAMRLASDVAKAPFNLIALAIYEDNKR